jgi:hypothetical protein
MSVPFGRKLITVLVTTGEGRERVFTVGRDVVHRCVLAAGPT